MLFYVIRIAKKLFFFLSFLVVFCTQNMYREKKKVTERRFHWVHVCMLVRLPWGGRSAGGSVELQTYEWNLAASLQVMGICCQGHLSNKRRQLLLTQNYWQGALGEEGEKKCTPTGFAFFQSVRNH